MDEFTQVQPSLESYWRAVILFGRNIASYKFALGKSLLNHGPFLGHIGPLSAWNAS